MSAEYRIDSTISQPLINPFQPTVVRGLSQRQLSAHHEGTYEGTYELTFQSIPS